MGRPWPAGLQLAVAWLLAAPLSHAQWWQFSPPSPLSSSPPTLYNPLAPNPTDGTMPPRYTTPGEEPPEFTSCPNPATPIQSVYGVSECCWRAGEPMRAWWEGEL
jgi:hypothetical protein